MMAKQNEFIAYLLELLEPLGAIKAKGMFGGFGIYRQDLMFGLVSEDTLYLKVDDQNRRDFESRDLGPFTYTRKGKEMSMSYFQVPPEVLDQGDELCMWAQKAWDAAFRAAQKKSTKNQRKK